MSLKFFLTFKFVILAAVSDFSRGPINSEFINIRSTLLRVNFLHSNLHYTRGTGITGTLKRVTSGGPISTA